MDGSNFRRGRRLGQEARGGVGGLDRDLSRRAADHLPDAPSAEDTGHMDEATGDKRVTTHLPLPATAVHREGTDEALRAQDPCKPSATFLPLSS
jgi:hypothetical protein